MNQPDKDDRIAKLLEKLPRQPDAAKVTLQGRAISRSAENLHLAVPTGIIAIPLTEIEDITPLTSIGDATLVSILVKDNSKVHHLMKVQPDAAFSQAGPTAGQWDTMRSSARSQIRGGGFGGGGVWLPPIFDCNSFTNDYIDSATASGGVLDQTDDVHPILQCDDHRA